jgi:hypothetical protein
MQYSTKGLDSAIQAEPEIPYDYQVQVPLYLQDQHSKATPIPQKAQTNKPSLIP